MKEIIDELSQKMQSASQLRDYETAIIYRDKIAYLNQMLKRNTFANIDGKTDIIVIIKKENTFIIEVLISRNSITSGQYSFFPKHTENANENEILTSFFEQFYTTHEIPQTILTNIIINNIQRIYF